MAPISGAAGFLGQSAIDGAAYTSMRNAQGTMAGMPLLVTYGAIESPAIGDHQLILPAVHPARIRTIAQQVVDFVGAMAISSTTC